ncbi:CRISPR-associated protein Cas1-like protein [Leptospira interrogans serovar Australis str. 200703203]|uniref:CRISPR-associated protein Cas1-like protein n=1 Tax=Leptospira interrogans serovar Australis str. 200703203 TaxID=1085541 RepID=N1UA50_LEPIR|nr:CRISPR-associated protein Cas1-like protein [Leptospira interrogans serovar Australis str. 200703203]
MIRKAQFKKSEIEKFRLEIARSIVAGKLQNCRSVLSRTARKSKNELEKQDIKEAIGKIEKNISLLEKAESIESIRGYEGDSAKTYFPFLIIVLYNKKKIFNFTKEQEDHLEVEQMLFCLFYIPYLQTIVSQFVKR